MKPRPTLREYTGLFNLAPADAEDPNEPCLRTAVDLPSLSHEEWDEACDAFLEIVVNHAPKERSTRFWRIHPPHLVDWMIDRTATIELGHFNECSESMVSAVQQRLAHDFPLWRVILRGSDEVHLIVYADAVNYDVDGELSDGLQRLKELEKSSRDVLVACSYRKLAYFERKRLASDPQVRRSTQLMLLNAFDNYQGDFHQVSIWVYFQGEDSWAVERVAPDDLASGSSFPVFENGTIGDQYSAEPAGEFIKEFVLDRDRLPFEAVVLHKELSLELRVPLDAGSLITDAQLRAMNVWPM